MEPVPIYVGIKSVHQFSHRENENNCYIGNYDICSLLDAQYHEGRKLIMTFSSFDCFGEPPISDIKLIVAEDRINDKGEQHKVAEIPKDYSYIDVALGKNKDCLLCFKKLDPMNVVYKAELIEKFPRENYADSELNQAINMFIFSEGIKLSKEQDTVKVFSFVLTSVDENGKISKIFTTCLVFYEQISDSLANQLYIIQTETNKVYMPKAICLASHWPFIEHYKEILKEIYRLTISTYEIPIERVICNLMQEVPLPDQGMTSVQYSIGAQSLKFSRPPAKYIPYIPDQSLEYLFRSLPIDLVIEVWSCLLVERKVLLISKSKALLTHVALALTSLIFPFKWDQVLIPILPNALKNYIETIFPYIIGVSPYLLTSEVEIPFDAVKVYLDDGKIESQENYPRLPDKLKRSLINSLNRSANIYSPNDPIRDTADEAFDRFIREDEDFKYFNPLQTKDAFLDFFTHLLKNYSKFFVMPMKSGDKVMDYRTCFNTADFLNYHKSNKPDTLLYRLTETSLFACFIESRYFSPIAQFELEYFDEALKFKRSKNDPFFVKPFQTRDVLPALLANDIGFEPDSAFRYERFPKLNDNYIVDPRIVQTLAQSTMPKLKLALKDDMLIRLSHEE